MTIVFFGSSEFSLPALEACMESGRKVVLVVTTPDQKKGRGLKLSPTPVKQFALERGIPVESPESLKDPSAFERAKNLQPDIFVVSSYGKFIPSKWLQIPKIISLNVHPSLLPKYRGASPVNRPILNGDSESGLSIAEVTSKLDAGDLFAQIRCPIDGKTDAESLSGDLAAKSRGLLLEVLSKVENGTLTRTPQDDSKSSYADKLKKEDGIVSFSESAQSIDRKVRGLKPWPGAYLQFEGQPLHFLECIAHEKFSNEKPGTLLESDNRQSILVATGQGVLEVFKVKPAGKKNMSAADFIRGKRLHPGSILGTS